MFNPEKHAPADPKGGGGGGRLKGTLVDPSAPRVSSTTGGSGSIDPSAIASSSVDPTTPAGKTAWEKFKGLVSAITYAKDIIQTTTDSSISDKEKLKKIQEFHDKRHSKK